ncbi:exodeoxyribonuclease III [Deinococcus yavapaiensis]|uniref:Exodeoxyribonuclease-3 n=1 Tax=Deinococcus yavapaiensis KR-236 TaxID=694435 RepID=A0A318S938_9DEIO|nr:exodeoxyribonuclease III [Deinococcus yavapaiensis]PYE55225.1 exodeoxyribonuclease-3 [Deinococcus yavapaiensis KR-236]
MSIEVAPPIARVATFNVNGLRSALRKGLIEWLARERPHVLLLQEVRADPHPEVFAELGYHSVWAPAVKAGYSGVAILSRRAPDEVRIGLGHEGHDAEGRVILARFAGASFASVYVPSGSSGETRQAVKDDFLSKFESWTRARLAEGPVLLGGDFNVAHREIDLKNWRSNTKNSGFLPHERLWMTNMLQLGLADTHRETLGERAEYSWWSNRGRAYENDVGWRLDYLLASGLVVRHVSAARSARLSDHAPIVGEIVGPSEIVRALV